MAEVLRAITAFEVMSKADGLPRMFTPGSLVFANDCDVKGREENFEPVEVAAARAARSEPGRASETASAAPGERRFRSKPAAESRQSQTETKETGS